MQVPEKQTIERLGDNSLEAVLRVHITDHILHNIR
jgi:hypothetical protein